jgi:hypothetical protein
MLIILPTGVRQSSKTGVLKLFVPGTHDEVKEKSGTSCKRNLVNTHLTFLLLIEKKVHNIAWLYNFQFISMHSIHFKMVCDRIAQISRLINAVNTYMNKDLWCPWKASLVPQFENRCSKALAIGNAMYIQSLTDNYKGRHLVTNE